MRGTVRETGNITSVNSDVFLTAGAIHTYPEESAASDWLIHRSEGSWVNQPLGEQEQASCDFQIKAKLLAVFLF